MFDFTNAPVTSWLFIALISGAAIHILYYWLIFSRLAFHKSKKQAHDSLPVSIIVCAKNEEKNLRKHLPAILEQAYHEFEVIVVNDCSWDQTAEYLKEIQPNYSQLKVVHIAEQDKYRHGKKFALTLGIKAAQHNYLLLTDADCMPAGKNWLANMQNHFSGKTEIVLGYGAYKKEGGFLNKFIRFDTFFIAMNYLSSALAGSAYMGVGRNLAYTKDLFFRNKGFAKHNHIFSGDDDLFVNANTTHNNTAIEINESSFTLSEAEKTWGDWFKQKIRHNTTGKYYKASHKFMLTLLPAGFFLFIGSAIALLVLKFNWRVVALAYAGKLILQLPVLIINSKRLREQDLIWFFPVFEFLHSILQLPLFIINLFTKPKAWK